MIKKRAHENPHRQIGTLDIGRLVGYAAATAANLQSRGFGAQTKSRRNKTSKVISTKASDGLCAT